MHILYGSLALSLFPCLVWLGWSVSGSVLGVFLRVQTLVLHSMLLISRSASRSASHLLHPPLSVPCVVVCAVSEINISDDDIPDSSAPRP